MKTFSAHRATQLGQSIISNVTNDWGVSHSLGFTPLNELNFFKNIDLWMHRNSSEWAEFPIKIFALISHSVCLSVQIGNSREFVGLLGWAADVFPSKS